MQKYYQHALVNHEDINRKKLDITHFLLRWQSYSIWTVTQVSNNTQDETGFPVWKKVIKVW